MINKSASSFCYLLFIRLFSTSTASHLPKLPRWLYPKATQSTPAVMCQLAVSSPLSPRAHKQSPEGGRQHCHLPYHRGRWWVPGASLHLLCHPCPGHPSSCRVHPSGRLTTPVPSDLRPSASRAQLCRGTWPSIFLHVKPRLSASQPHLMPRGSCLPTNWPSEGALPSSSGASPCSSRSACMLLSPASPKVLRTGSTSPFPC